MRIYLTAGKKLRALAIERTRQHILDQRRGSGLIRELQRMTEGMTTAEYCADELKRLEMMERGE